jgi:hypothetical protein
MGGILPPQLNEDVLGKILNKKTLVPTFLNRTNAEITRTYKLQKIYRKVSGITNFSVDGMKLPGNYWKCIFRVCFLKL